MSVKILGGLARGFTLATPRSESTRPTSVLIRRKLFDWRQNLEGYIFIDLFAGSGAVGFEALSRGAEQILLNDRERGAFLTLKQNEEAFSKAFKAEKSSIVVTNLDAKSWITRELSYRLPDTEDAILYLDPPYGEHQLYTDCLEQLKAVGYRGEVWLEADRLQGPASELLTGAFHSVIKTVLQGDHFVVVGKLL